MWTVLGINDITADSIQVDRSGSVVLEHILGLSKTTVPGLSSVNLKELVVTTCWYLWWIRRRRTYAKDVPLIQKMQVLNLFDGS
jgi:hypothetical protein